MKRISLLLLFMLPSVWSLANHWEPDSNQFPDNMNLIGVIGINGIEQTTEAFELGAFCDTECRGSEMLVYYEGLDRYMVFMTLYGQSGDELTFKIYDHVTQQELEVESQVTVQFVPNEILGAVHDPFVVAFTGGYCLITAHAIPEEGGAITGSGGYRIGETCTLQATANEGYSFVEWTEEDNSVSNRPSISFVVTQNRNLEAHFTYFDGVEESETTWSIFPNPTLGKVTITGVDEGCVIHLTDENGRLLLTQKCERMNMDIDLSAVQDGCYFLYVLSERNKNVRKLIKMTK